MTTPDTPTPEPTPATPLMIHGIATITVCGPGYDDSPGDPHTGKPYLRVELPGIEMFCITANLASLIGGLGRGAAARWEDLQRLPGGPLA